MFVQTVMEREPAPYGKCRENNNPKHNVYVEKYPVEYSTEVSQYHEEIQSI